MNNRKDNVHSNLVQQGILTAVKRDDKGYWGRVTHYERDKIQSAWLQVLMPHTVGNQRFERLQTGGQVSVIYSGKGMEHGVILGGTYNSTQTPPVSLSDGSNIGDSHAGDIYKDQGEVYFDGGGTYVIYTKNKVVVKADVEVDVTAPKVVVNASDECDVTSPLVKINASSEVDITSPTINISGNVNLTGNLTVLGDTKLTGDNLATPNIANEDGSGGGS